jgi:hypothetical protein
VGEGDTVVAAAGAAAGNTSMSLKYASFFSQFRSKIQRLSTVPPAAPPNFLALSVFVFWSASVVISKS